ncbi:hypothetical protein CS022_03660 [Veronia nyctiphanis]|uniref:Uncharacterized protein n=1 Tax=Veronia nyctiphanis TaxID=1278244 RepID=A0A4Q0YTW8_9GAMM|nr:hypothetical protein [Veronia nyctiphanis]RXJ74183.1 hypothetical protein CS022_03660 [Veronia nyctiphanis]
MWTAAEAHIALGEPEKAKQAFEQAKAFAIENGLPKGLFEELEKVEQEVLYGQYAEETPKLKGLGLYRLPASPSQTNLSCAMCHAGAQVPDHYYSWK